MTMMMVVKIAAAVMTVILWAVVEEEEVRSTGWSGPEVVSTMRTTKIMTLR